MFGIYHDAAQDVSNIVFNRETLPYIPIGGLLEKEFMCNSIENCQVVLVMRRQFFDVDVQGLIVDYTDTAFPASGNLALSVNSSVSSRIMDISSLRLIPEGIRERQAECGVCAIGFQPDSKNEKLMRKQILISPDTLLRKSFAAGLIRRGV